MKNPDWLEKTKQLRSAGSFEQTMAHLAEVLLERPIDPLVHLQIAWTHDSLGKEHDAFPAYEKAIALGLHGQELKDAFLGLGSTYRTIGEYQKSKEVFQKALDAFPDHRPFRVFLSLTLYNLGDHAK